MITPIIK